jgi:hypothetical protein
VWKNYRRSGCLTASLADRLYRLVNRQKHFIIARYPTSTEDIQIFFRRILNPESFVHI